MPVGDLLWLPFSKQEPIPDEARGLNGIKYFDLSLLIFKVIVDNNDIGVIITSDKKQLAMSDRRFKNAKIFILWSN